MHVYSKNISLYQISTLISAKYVTIKIGAKKDESKVELSQIIFCPLIFSSCLRFYTILERIDFANVASTITLGLQQLLDLGCDMRIAGDGFLIKHKLSVFYKSSFFSKRLENKMPRLT